MTDTQSETEKCRESEDNQYHHLWSFEEKPTSLNQIVGNQSIIESLQTYLKSYQVPNMILSGPNGCGKQAAVRILLDQYLGSYLKIACLQIPGSINRGKNIVSENNEKKKAGINNSPSIINFIKKRINLPPNRLKIVVIYDFDSMTDEAQMALRRIIEIHINKVRFIFICNHLNKIIEAIQSRTIIFKFSPLTAEQITGVLRKILDRRKMPINSQIIDSIAILSNGDLKLAINYLQTFSHCAGQDLKSFNCLFNIPSIHEIERLIAYSIRGHFNQAIVIFDQLLENGYHSSDLLDILLKVLIYTPNLKSHQKVQYLQLINQCFLLNELYPSIIHFYDLIAQFSEKKRGLV